ncbi:MAG TPA: phage tail sheath C-terminal domain-containing protein [Pyrinomonadaceae bacterium]|nr:phage tail sheath C-terminal domain-containing protein [Pyrinomonadaceae bacterium]
MPEYLSPGVYVEEISTGPIPIEGVSTSTAGMLGATERGPEPPRLITSWLQFQRWYGGYVPDISYLAYAIQGFFDNGGQRCYVGRIVADDAAVTTGAVGAISLFANGRGAWGNHIMVKVDDSSNQNSDSFRVSILYFRNPPAPADFVDPTSTSTADLVNPKRREPDVLEVFDNLSEQVGASNNVVNTINSASRLVRAEWNGTPARPPNQGFTALGTNGSDSASAANIVAADFIGDADPIPGAPNELLGRGRGIVALEGIDDISLLLAPDEVRRAPEDLSQVTEEILNQCERLKDRFGLVSVEQGRSDPTSPTVLNPPRDTSYAAFYYPWIEIFDPSINDRRLIPPTGHVAGICARTDVERGVHKAPANEVVRGARNLEFNVPRGLQDVLNPRGVNCFRDFRSDGLGIRLWGARTMSSNGEWKYINVRRLFLFIEESIDEGTQWVVFEPNDEPLWARVRRSISNFLYGVWRSGALMGTTQEEAFFVKCDRTTMTQDDIDNGRLICYIGIAPVKPAEFVIFRINHKTIDAQQ